MLSGFSRRLFFIVFIIVLSFHCQSVLNSVLIYYLEIQLSGVPGFAVLLQEHSDSERRYPLALMLSHRFSGGFLKQ